MTPSRPIPLDPRAPFACDPDPSPPFPSPHPARAQFFDRSSQVCHCLSRIQKFGSRGSHKPTPPPRPLVLLGPHSAIAAAHAQMPSAFLHRLRPRRSSPHRSSAKLLRRSSSRFYRPPARLRELNRQQIHRRLCILHQRSVILCGLLASVSSSHSPPAPSPICAAPAVSRRGWRRVIEASSAGALPVHEPKCRWPI
jgi:hypothetical protein